MARRQSGWVVAAASLAAVGGMWIAGYGAEGAPPPAKVAAVASAPPGPCLQGSGDLGETYYPGIGNSGYDVSHYDLNLKYDPATKWLDGKATITASATQHLCRFNLDLRGLKVNSVKVDGVSATFVRDGRELIITPATPLLPSTGFAVEVLYEGEPGPAPRDPDGFLDGWNYTEHGAYTSTPPQGADTWYPNNNTTTDKAAFTFTVTVPADRQVMSNGILISNTINEAAGTSTWVWDAPDPMVTYLATLQIGKYTIQKYTTPSGLPIINGIRPDQLTAQAQQRLDTIPAILDFFGSKFGPYPFSASGAIVDLVNAGYQMEQQTRPIFTSANGLSALAHELAHQWFGDSVAWRRARDVWLSEGFATFAAWMWTENTGGITARQAFLNAWNRASLSWANTVVDPGVVNQYQNATVYTRGGMTLQALRMKIGDDAFFRTLRAYHETYKGSTAETQDFIAVAQRESGQDLRDFFKVWLYQPGKPSEAYCSCLTPPATPGNVSGTVPATLSLTLDGPASFAPFTPGVEKDYTATTKATVTSSAADATLSVSEPGFMTNGPFSLAEPLRIELSKSAWTGPVSNDEVTVTAKQLVKAKDPLRTGSYSKTVTFTLSTTSP
ncbi:M1 family metallopeptidase [Solirubrobacter phytolaccae]|uniref:Aminopeptidase N n=1 Tax=Solirubrobacter phytolaccae TaxID=1404360 RepID=A0A9X3NIR1_9ACTN|nr:M1 family metallopeptidase [Solirubrobacter phytolaccae]MDA0182082.1 M1 family metallopeptidase [Solirubrobacter phytolaccae]